MKIIIMNEPRTAPTIIAFFLSSPGIVGYTITGGGTLQLAFSIQPGFLSLLPVLSVVHHVQPSLSEQYLYNK